MTGDPIRVGDVLPEVLAQLTGNATVRHDPVRGHITVSSDHGPAELTFVDLGPVLDVWAHQGVRLTPRSAAELGRVLLAWSASKEPRRSRLSRAMLAQAQHEATTWWAPAWEELCVELDRSPTRAEHAARAFHHAWEGE